MIAALYVHPGGVYYGLPIEFSDVLLGMPRSVHGAIRDRTNRDARGTP